MPQDRRQFLIASVAAGAAATVPFSWPDKKTRPSVVVLVMDQPNKNGRTYVKGSFKLPPTLPLYGVEMARLREKSPEANRLPPVGVGHNFRVEGDNLLCDVVWHGPYSIPEHAVRTRGHGVVSEAGVVSDFELDGLMLTETPS